MPQLPSGRHVAVRAEPLETLLRRANELHNVPRVLAVRCAADLMPWIELNELVAPRLASPQAVRFELVGPSEHPPAGLLVQGTGVRLHEWSRLALAEPADEHALREWVASDRMQSYLGELLATVRRVQQALRGAVEPAIHLQCALFDQNRHPCQTEHWPPRYDAEAPSMQWSPAVLVAALALAAQAMAASQQALAEDASSAAARLAGWCGFALPSLGFDMPAEACPGMPPQALASSWRAEARLAALPAERRHWFERQATLEAALAWDALKPSLQRLCWPAASIIELAALSPGALP